METSPVCVLPGVPRITLVTVKLVALLMVYVSTPRVVEAATPALVRIITSPVAIFVFAIVCVPAVKTPVPMKSVTAPPLTQSVRATDAITK